MSTMKCLMQIAYMRHAVRDESCQHHIDWLLVHESPQRAYDYVRPLWESATK